MFIVWGSKGIYRTVKDGKQVANGCPKCRGNLLETTVKQYFTLYYIPLFPTKNHGNVMRCDRCQQSYDMAIATSASKFVGEEAEKKIKEMAMYLVMETAYLNGHPGEKEVNYLKAFFGENNADKFNELSLLFQEGRKDEELIADYEEIIKAMNGTGKYWILYKVYCVLKCKGELSEEDITYFKKVITLLGFNESIYDFLQENFEKKRAEEESI